MMAKVVKSGEKACGSDVGGEDDDDVNAGFDVCVVIMMVVLMSICLAMLLVMLLRMLRLMRL